MAARMENGQMSAWADLSPNALTLASRIQQRPALYRNRDMGKGEELMDLRLHISRYELSAPSADSGRDPDCTR
jgi:hypothetical protein